MSTRKKTSTRQRYLFVARSFSQSKREIRYERRFFQNIARVLLLLGKLTCSVSTCSGWIRQVVFVYSIYTTVIAKQVEIKGAEKITKSRDTSKNYAATLTSGYKYPPSIEMELVPWKRIPTSEFSNNYPPSAAPDLPSSCYKPGTKNDRRGGIRYSGVIWISMQIITSHRCCVSLRALRFNEFETIRCAASPISATRVSMK